MAERGQALPPLSSTYQSSYLWAPHHLQRLTITQRHYHNYVAHSLDSQPPHLNALRRRVQKYGDNRFHVHRDIPEHQDYSLTALKLSNLRPADQLVDRPMSRDSRVVHKEVCQPFPAEHPYTSHISQFSVFPDTHPPHPHIATATGHTHRDIGTQTLATTLPYFVTQKAFEKGLRIERHHQSCSGHVTDHMIQQDGRGQLWDLPRSHRHQRSKTYPAPHVQYSSSHSAKPPHTQEALDSIHSLVAGTTSYTDHFRLPHPPEGPNQTTGGRMSTSGGQNLGAPRPLYSSFSHSRPYTAESRSKYRGTLVVEDIGDDWEWEEEGEREGEVKVVIKKDVATQTEPDDEYPPLWSTGQPQSTNNDQTKATTGEPKRPNMVELRPLTTTGVERRQRSFSVDEGLTFRPRSSLSSRRFSQLYGFSRSDIMKQFHSQFPEPVPDLRQYGMQKGRRHIIHGYNSYYFH